MGEENRYDKKDAGPYIAFVADEQKGNSLGNLHIMSMGKKLESIYKSIVSISPVGREKYKVVFDSYQEANKFMNLIKVDICDYWVAYIPFQTFSKVEVMTGVDTTLSEEEIKAVIKFEQEDVHLVRVQRMKRKTTNMQNPVNTAKNSDAHGKLEDTTAV